MKVLSNHGSNGDRSADCPASEHADAADQTEAFHAFGALRTGRLQAVAYGGDGAPGKELSLFGRVIVVDQGRKVGSCVLHRYGVQSTEEEVLCLHAEQSVTGL